VNRVNWYDVAGYSTLCLEKTIQPVASNEQRERATFANLAAFTLDLLLLLLLLGECLNGQGLQAVRVTHSSLCKLNQLLCHHLSGEVLPVNQAQRPQYLFKDAAEHGDFFGLK
jgi:hypothetical protein